MPDLNILIVDDESTIRMSLRMILEYEGYIVTEAEDGPRAIALARKRRPDLVLLDVKMPGMDGLEVLNSLQQDYPDMPVIIVSGHGNIQTAVQATKQGAVDFLEKPPQKDRILLSIKNALSMNQLKSKQQIQPDDPYRIIGESHAIQQVLATIKKVAPSNLSVLIRGESGTGKELAARAVHKQSTRHNGPFIQVNCAAIPEDLIENELFGHEKGSYTGAAEQRQGKFELAHNGTLFLDEIGDMSLKTQAKVLRALQEGEFQRVGGSRTLNADVRVVAATNQDLEEMIKEGSFREDLYFRINGVPITMPPLRNRSSDISALIDHFIKLFVRKNTITAPVFTQAAIKLLVTHHWTGNIRELKNVVERHLILAPGPEITESYLEPLLKNSSLHSDQSESLIASQNTLQEFKEAAEQQFLITKLKENNWNIKATAENIGTPRSNLYKRMQHFGIERNSYN